MEDKNDEDFYGGMYNLLDWIRRIITLKKKISKSNTINRDDLIIICNKVSKDTISNNLTRLVKLGALERIESRDPNNNNCRCVIYKLKEDGLK